MPGMLKFIRQNVPSDAQLVLALENLHGIDFDGDTIVLDQKNRVMLDGQDRLGERGDGAASRDGVEQ